MADEDRSIQQSFEENQNFRILGMLMGDIFIGTPFEATGSEEHWSEENEEDRVVSGNGENEDSLMREEEDEELNEIRPNIIVMEEEDSLISEVKDTESTVTEFIVMEEEDADDNNTSNLEENSLIREEEDGEITVPEIIILEEEDSEEEDSEPENASNFGEQNPSNLKQDSLMTEVEDEEITVPEIIVLEEEDSEEEDLEPESALNLSEQNALSWEEEDTSNSEVDDEEITVPEIIVLEEEDSEEENSEEENSSNSNEENASGMEEDDDNAVMEDLEEKNFSSLKERNAVMEYLEDANASSSEIGNAVIDMEVEVPESIVPQRESISGNKFAKRPLQSMERNTIFSSETANGSYPVITKHKMKEAKIILSSETRGEIDLKYGVRGNKAQNTQSIYGEFSSSEFNSSTMTKIRAAAKICKFYRQRCSKFQIHRRKYTERKTSNLPVCNCKMHECVHRRMKRYECSFCRAQFYFYVSMKSHVLAHKCVHCDLEFSNLLDLEKHEVQHQGKEERSNCRTTVFDKETPKHCADLQTSNQTSLSTTKKTSSASHEHIFQATVSESSGKTVPNYHETEPKNIVLQVSEQKSFSESEIKTLRETNKVNLQHKIIKAYYETLKKSLKISQRCETKSGGILKACNKTYRSSVKTSRKFHETKLSYDNFKALTVTSLSDFSFVGFIPIEEKTDVRDMHTRKQKILSGKIKADKSSRVKSLLEVATASAGRNRVKNTPLFTCHVCSIAYRCRANYEKHTKKHLINTVIFKSSRVLVMRRRNREREGERRSQSRERVRRSQSTERVTRSQSRERVTRSQSRERVTRSQSRERVTRSQSRERVTRSQSRERVTRSQSRERVTRSQSRERVTRSQSRERVTRSQSRERVTRSQSRERVTRSQSRERETRNQSRDRALRSQSGDRLTRNQSRERVRKSQSRGRVRRSQSTEGVAWSQSRNIVTRSQSRERVRSQSLGRVTRSLSRDRVTRCQSRERMTRSQSRDRERMFRSKSQKRAN